LSFAAGDTIEIVDETNADWWTGRVNGKQGLFPSTYVEKLAHPAPNGNSEKKPYKPFGAAYQGMDSPPPTDQGVNPIGLQVKEGTEGKKDRFGQYKSTVEDFFLFAFQPSFIHSTSRSHTLLLEVLVLGLVSGIRVFNE
jgi:hypothetical protein